MSFFSRNFVDFKIGFGKVSGTPTGTYIQISRCGFRENILRNIIANFERPTSHKV
jgi:hypothetical protein